MRLFLFSLFVLTSCTVPDKTSLKVMRETRKLRKSPVTLRAYKSGKVTYDKLELRMNNSFAYQSNVLGTQKCVFYAGTFTKNGDTLILNFHNNYKDSLWTGKAVIDTTKKEITLISTNTSFNKQMTIN
jgi:hypothetical protein